MEASKPVATAGYVWRGLFALVMVGAMGTLVVVLGGERDAGRAALNGYVGAIGNGSEVSASVGGDEAEELTRLLRKTQSFSIQNFQGQASTACFWVSLHHGGASTDARFVLAGDGATRTVTAASLRRECNCPDPDTDQPCHLR